MIAIAAAKLIPIEARGSNNNDHHFVHMITRVGKDSFGQLVKDNFTNEHVHFNTDTITCSTSTSTSTSSHGSSTSSSTGTSTGGPSSHTGVASIIVHEQTGDNMIIVVPGE